MTPTAAAHGGRTTSGRAIGDKTAGGRMNSDKTTRNMADSGTTGDEPNSDGETSGVLFRQYTNGIGTTRRGMDGGKTSGDMMVCVIAVSAMAGNGSTGSGQAGDGPAVSSRQKLPKTLVRQMKRQTSIGYSDVWFL